MRSHKIPAPVASASDILTRFLSSAPLMRADHFSSWVRELTARQGQPVRAQIDEEDDDEYVLPWERSIYSVNAGIALVDVSGPIVKGYDALTCWCWGMMSSDRLADACKELAARADVYAVVFKFHSPGGMAQGTPETSAQIKALSMVKTTVAFTDTMCCSAAYWMACQCGAVVATMTADVGSIGTYAAFYDYTGMLEKEGIKLELFARGKYKAMGIAGKPLTDEQRAFMDADIDRMNERFLSAVRAARPGVSDETMQGQWFDGEQAVTAKLADAVVTDLSEVIGELMARMRPVSAGI